MGATVDGLGSAVEALAALDPARLADGESLLGLLRQVERLEAVVTRAIAAFDSGRTWEADGARSAAAWLATRARLPASECCRQVQTARQLRHLPLVEEAWRAGRVSRHHVDAFCRVRTAATTESFARDEAVLVGQAERLAFRHFQRMIMYWQQLADPVGVEHDADADHAARRLHLSQTMGGRWFLDGLFDPINGTIVADGLKRIEDELFEADWAKARARLGDRASANDVVRTAAQRRADALVELVRRAEAMPADAKVPEPLFTVLVGYETFAGRICELANGSVVTPGSLVGWLDEAWVERVVFDTPDRVKNVGKRRRLFRGATRRAVEMRDRECFHPYCDAPVGAVQVDHVLPWAAGGSTTDDNGRLACGYHNRRRHRPP
jgi:hypothetical protein